MYPLQGCRGYMLEQVIVIIFSFQVSNSLHHLIWWWLSVEYKLVQNIKYIFLIIFASNYRIRRCPVPCKFGKILVVDHFVEKNYIENLRIWNYFKKDFLNFSFHYVRYCNHPVTFLKIFLISLLLQALNEVSISKIFLVFFFYIWSFKVDSIFIIIRI